MAQRPVWRTVRIDGLATGGKWSAGHASMACMTPGAPRLVLGDEEFLASRAVAALIAQARAADPGAMVDEFLAGEMSVGDLMGAVSPALFGGERVVVIHNGQDARKELIAEILTYAAAPEPDVTLIVTHAGGTKGKALADGLRDAGAVVTNASKLTKHRERLDFVRDEIRQLGGKAGED